MTTISNNDIARAIYLASKEENQGGHFSPKVVQFLAHRRLLPKAPDILLRLDKIINKEEGIIVVKISSKNYLHEKIKKELIDILEKRYKGKSILLKENIDQGLLGGFKIEINDEVIDLTIKNKIRKLQEYLTETI